MDERAACTLEAAEAGAAVAAASFRTEIAAETKEAKTDLVTQADRDAQREVAATIRSSYPEETIIAEEDDDRTAIPESGPAWVVDPIDGTNNYVRGVQIWGTAVAALDDGEAVAGATVCPALGDSYVYDGEVASLNGEKLTVSRENDPEAFHVAPGLWWAPDRREEFSVACRGILERFGDLRRYGSMQVALGMIASGALEGIVTNRRANPWDSVVGVALIEAAGGTVTNLAGENWRHDSRGLVASNGEVHDLLVEIARETDAAGERR